MCVCVCMCVTVCVLFVKKIKVLLVAATLFTADNSLPAVYYWTTILYIAVDHEITHFYDYFLRSRCETLHIHFKLTKSSSRNVQKGKIFQSNFPVHYPSTVFQYSSPVEWIVTALCVVEIITSLLFGPHRVMNMAEKEYHASKNFNRWEKQTQDLTGFISAGA